jgi:phosphate transport system substrate-binding protein
MRLLVILLAIFIYSCNSKVETLKIKGSDTEVNLAVLLAEQFHLENAKILVSISGGGSGLGIASLLNGNADIANSSRSMKSDELALFEKNNIAIDSFIFAQDAIAFVVSEQISLDSISTTTIAKILNGTLNDWSKLNQAPNEIIIYGRQSNSGTHDFIKKVLGIQFSPYAKQMNGNAQILEAIKQDNTGIGYVSAGYVINGNANGIKVLKVYHENSSAISPLDLKAIASNKYFFQRPLFQYYRKNDIQKVEQFLQFEKSIIGKKIIQKSGYYPVLSL